MKSCVFPGTFDPVTVGHLSVIERAARLFDQVTVTLMVNVRKHCVFSLADRKRMMEKVCAPFPQVRVDVWDGLLADYMRIRGESCLIRGARDAAEFEAEIKAEQVNRLLYPGMTTLLMPAEEGLGSVSSSMVRELAAFRADIRPFVPACAAEEIARILSKEGT